MTLFPRRGFIYFYTLLGGLSGLLDKGFKRKGGRKMGLKGEKNGVDFSILNRENIFFLPERYNDDKKLCSP